MWKEKLGQPSLDGNKDKQIMGQPCQDGMKDKDSTIKDGETFEDECVSENVCKKND